MCIGPCKAASGSQETHPYNIGTAKTGLSKLPQALVSLFTKEEKENLLTGLDDNVCLVAELCPTLCNPMDCSLPGCSVHSILQARILEGVANPFSRGYS